ncbi:MAG: IS110 family transposase [Lachnospiraceae bacterium]|nr:IS110 family transposase [Lachnospiraceae bacterium]
MTSKMLQNCDKTLIIGIDIAKKIHWAQVTDSIGKVLCKPIKITNDIEGFTNFLDQIHNLSSKFEYEQIYIGFEPSGHYWRAIAWYLNSYENIHVVGVNPYHVKQLKELEDNSQTKNDKKDALVIAHLIRDGRYFDIYLPEDHYADLRILRTYREQISDNRKRIHNHIVVIMDEFFPEYESIGFNMSCLSSKIIFRTTPFPADIKSYSASELRELWKEQSPTGHIRISNAFTERLISTASRSIGVTEGVEAARFKLNALIDQLDLVDSQIEQCDSLMDALMQALDIDKFITSVPGVGSVTAASFIAETGDLSRFDDWKQIRKLAGLNLVEQSSGQHKGKTKVSKRGRPGLRKVIYLIGDKGMLVSPEMMSYYQYLRHRKNNQLKHDQAVLAVGLKLMRIMFHVVKYKELYNPDKALGDVRKKQILELA